MYGAKSGMWAEFRFTTWGAVLTLVSVFLPFRMIAPGAMSVVMVDRRPLEFEPQVALDAGHQALHVVGEVELAGVFRRDDEPELVVLARARPVEGLGA